MESTLKPNNMNNITAESILKKHWDNEYPNQLSGYEGSLFKMSASKYVLEAMKEIASLAFEAGHEYGCASEAAAYWAEEVDEEDTPSKEQFINQLFPDNEK